MGRRPRSGTGEAADRSSGLFVSRGLLAEEVPRLPAGRRARIEVRVELKAGILDAEAESIQKSLTLLGIPALHRVRTARLYDLEFDGLTEGEALARAQEAVDRLLANPVIHRVSIRTAAD